MFEFTESVLIQASPSAVWEVLRDVEAWWPASNPEHDSLERLNDREVTEVGARLRIRERIGGIPGEAVGQITRVDPLSAVTWEAPRARYRWFGFSVTIGEGVTWSIEGRENDTTRLSAHVWATFPAGLRGRLLQAVFTHVVGGVEKDREHARVELRYLKATIEGTHTPDSGPGSGQDAGLQREGDGFSKTEMNE